MATKTIENRITQLENIIATNPPNSQEAIEAQKLLDAVLQANNPAVTPAQVGSLDDVVAILATLKQAMRGSGGSVSAADIRAAVLDEMDKRKITENDLSASLMASLNATRKVNLNVAQLLGVTTRKDVTAEELNDPLMQKVLSDLMARNNVYLYGQAGTGKTFLAERIAYLLGWEEITINCNQFTSPLDILGGQTIDGYQEGKLSMAWSNKIDKLGELPREVIGAVLILDELPKIDPNTAGVLNAALAKTKDFRKDETTGEYIRPTIRNGKNDVLVLKNLFIIATGNVPLNTIDPDYEANFKQDLSLQDRFVGSTYIVKFNYQRESTNIMVGFLFIWLFLVRVRQAIIDARAASQAFVSLRIMISAKVTYIAYRRITEPVITKKGNITNQAITKPKTLIDTMDAFFDLLKPTVKQTVINSSDYDGFKNVLAQKDKMPYNDAQPNFDTPAEIKEAIKVTEDYNLKQQTP